MQHINDKWVRIGGVALLSMNLLFFSASQRDVADEVIYIATYLGSVVLILETGRLIILRQHRKYDDQLRRRTLFWKTCLYVSVTYFTLILATFYLSHVLRGMRPGNSPAWFIAICLASAVLAIIHTGIYEGFYYFFRLRRVEQEKEELLRTNLQSQFDSLKQQVNPHFLFNSINTVSSLIDKDPQQAKKFLAEMSKVYRYLLQANEEKLVTIDAELKFVEPYFHLLKTRFSDALHLNVQIGEKYRHFLLPVLTLQLLLENAIKHNIVERARPLTIDVTISDEGYLSVRNNLQKKKQNIASTKVGLANIMAKYKLLNQPEILVKETDKDFIVLLPLIQNGAK